jgi:hypothetical protein
MMFIVFDITFAIGIILFVVLEKRETSEELSNAYNSYLALQNVS